MMAEPQVCRGCLSHNVLLYPVPRSYTEEFEILTRLSFQSSSGKPHGLCHECCYNLRRCHRFRVRCLRADNVLNQHSQSNVVLTSTSIERASWDLSPSLIVMQLDMIDVPPATDPALPMDELDMDLPMELTIKCEPSYSDDEACGDEGSERESRNEDTTANVAATKCDSQIDTIKNEIQDIDNKYEPPETNELTDRVYGEESAANKSNNVLTRNKKGNINFSQTQKAVDEIKSEPLTSCNTDSSDDVSIQSIKGVEGTGQSSKSNAKVASNNKSTTSQELECGICHKLLKGKKVLQVHMRTHSGIRPHMCTVCNKGFTRKSGLNIHLKSHTGDQPFHCDFCNRNFTLETTLKIHMRRHTGEKPYPCTVCSKQFAVAGSLRLHMRTHTGEEPYECPVCSKRFKDNQRMKLHIRTHTGDKPYECELCKKRFAEKLTMTRHQKIHIYDRERPYACPVCDKRFTDKRTLPIHMRTHTGERPFECPVCSSRFNQRSYLKTHMRIHTGDKPYQCLVCNKQFTQGHCLTTHSAKCGGSFAGEDSSES